MNTIIFLAIVVVLIMAGLAAISKKKGLKTDGPIQATAPLTANEQPMYFRLVEAFPEHVVLAQVAFGALMQTKDRMARNRFDRKRADFVLCSKAFEVIAVIELDDSSHNGREQRDAARDNLLTSCGYRVLRYKRVPDVAALRKAAYSDELVA